MHVCGSKIKEEERNQNSNGNLINKFFTLISRTMSTLLQFGVNLKSQDLKKMKS